jgi:hypothetical protein
MDLSSFYRREFKCNNKGERLSLTLKDDFFNNT